MAASSLIQAVGNGVSWYGFTIFFLPITRDLGISHAATSLLFSAARIEGGLEGPIVGMLIDRFGPRKLAALGIALVGIGYILLAAAQDFLSVFIVYVFVISIGNNTGFFHAVATAVNSWFIRRRAFAMGIMSAASASGGFFLVPPLAVLIQQFGWRPAAALVGVVVLLTLPAAFVLRRSPESCGLLPDGQPPPEPRQVGPEASSVAIDFTVRQALRTTTFWLLALAVTTRMIVTSGLVVHMVPILVWKDMDEPGAAWMVSFFALASIGTRFSSGWLGDRMSKTLLSAGGALIGLAGLLVLIFSQSREALYIFVLSQAFTEGSIPINWVLVGDFFGRKIFATLRGLMSVMYSAGVFVSPIFAGWVFDSTGSYQWALVAFAVVFAASVVVFLVIKHPAPPPPQPKGD